MPMISRARLDALTAYLAQRGGQDVLEYADLAEARRAAQELRAQLADAPNSGIAVEQRHTRVVMTLARVPSHA